MREELRLKLRQAGYGAWVANEGDDGPDIIYDAEIRRSTLSEEDIFFDNMIEGELEHTRKNLGEMDVASKQNFEPPKDRKIIPFPFAQKNG